MIYKETKYDYIVVGSDGEIYTTYYPGYTKKKCTIRKGLKTFRIKHGGHKKSVGVAKLVGELFIDNPNKYRYILTKDGDELNTHPDNLYWSKSNRMDYKAFSKKKTGTVYKFKSYRNKIVNNYVVIEDDTEECTLACINCYNIIVIPRFKINKFKRKCSKCTSYPLEESLLVSDKFKNWIVSETEDSKKIKNKSLKKLNIVHKELREKQEITYVSFKNRKTNYYCTLTKNKRKNLLWKLALMKQRCYNKNNKSYTSYGAKGITVCDEWLNDSEKFISWSLTNGFDFGMEIDRKDNNKKYSPSNCQYLTKKEHIKKHLKLTSDN